MSFGKRLVFSKEELDIATPLEKRSSRDLDVALSLPIDDGEFQVLDADIDEDDDEHSSFFPFRFPPLLPKLRGGGGREYQDMVIGITSGTAKCLMLVVVVFMVQNGARLLVHSQEFGENYMMGAASIVVGLAIFFNTVAGLVGLWRTYQNDENFDTQLLKWTHLSNLWFLLMITAHSLAVLRYFRDPPDSAPILLTNPSFHVTKFWVCTVDFVVIVLLVLDTVSLLGKDPAEVEGMHLASIQHSSTMLLVAGATIITLITLVLEKHSSTRLHWPEDYPSYMHLGLWCVIEALLVLIFIFSNRVLAKYGLPVLGVIGITSLVFTSLVYKNSKHNDNEYLAISVLISFGAELFMLIMIVAFLSLRGRDHGSAEIRNHPLSFQ